MNTLKTLQNPGTLRKSALKTPQPGDFREEECTRDAATAGDLGEDECAENTAKPGGLSLLPCPI